MRYGVLCRYSMLGRDVWNMVIRGTTLTWDIFNLPPGKMNDCREFRW